VQRSDLAKAVRYSEPETVREPQTVETQDRQRPRPRAPSLPGSTTVASPLEALERDELLRTRWFCVVAAAIAVVGGFGVVVLPGDPTLTLIVMTACGLSLAAIGFLLLRTGDPAAFRQRSTILGWFIPAVCITSAIPYFGVFSPAPVVLVLGVYFTGLGRSPRLAYAVYAVCAGMQALFSVLVISGAMTDRGLIHRVELSRPDQVIVQVLVQFVLLATLVTARMSRRTALLAASELERAVRTAAHREALLLEAREELERALRAGRGRFTGQQISTYQIGKLIGRGAMGEVYEGSDVHNARVVAIKLLSQASLGNRQHVLRFLRELRTAAGINSPNVVEVYEVGEDPVPFLVMERLEGTNLAEVLRTRRALAPAEVLDLVQQIGAGITAAAAAGIVHRDLKPQNLFLHGGTWKILDFGVARAIDSGDSLTAGNIVGTPSYMAPEQAAGDTVDHCTDLYALAAIAYRALTGHPPYAAGEIAETLYRVVHTRPRRPTELLPGLPYEINLVLAIGMAKRPADRFASAHDFALALADAIDDELAIDLRDRGERLDREGAWTTNQRRSTARMRP
jgi:eukaryotic-like serine/threonine-protein kinase